MDYKTLYNIFDKDWLNALQDKEFEDALVKNDDYKKEVNDWLDFFDKKKWLDEKLKNRLRSGKTWASFYSKINEIRMAFFFEKKLNFYLTDYESQTINNKNVEFKARINNLELCIEIKTLPDLIYKENLPIPEDVCDEIDKDLEKAVKQLPEDKPNIVVLADDLRMSLLDDPRAQNDLYCLLNSSEYQKISAVCVFGNISLERMYEMKWALNDNAKFLLSKEIFDNFLELPYKN